MSRASRRNHARLTRLAHRARRKLQRSRRGRLLLHANKTFSVVGLHIKSYDVDHAVDEALSRNDASYSPARDNGKKMCGELDVCGNTMNAVLIMVSAKLQSRGWTFRYDDPFIAKSQTKTVREFKTAVYGNTQ